MGNGHERRYPHCELTKSARELMRKKERAVLAAQHLISEKELEHVYGQIAQGVLTCTGSMRVSDDNAVAAAVCLLVSAGRVEGSHWVKWRAFGPMWQDLRVV